MRRFVAALALVLALTGATWCVDGCEDASATKNPGAPITASCTFCVVPFAVVVAFDLGPERLQAQEQRDLPEPRLVSTPPLTIDHPPRLI